jgi:hypothetical protein
VLLEVTIAKTSGLTGGYEASYGGYWKKIPLKKTGLVESHLDAEKNASTRKRNTR